MTSNINPTHYKTENDSYQCIDVIQELCKHSDNDTFTDYNRFQAFKYIWRAGSKGSVSEDLKKAIAFLQFAIQYEDEGKEKNYRGHSR